MDKFNPHKILGLVIPTNEPNTAYSHILKSIDAFKEVAPISTFLINFQDPWTRDQMIEVVNLIKNYGFDVEYSFNTYEVKGKGLVPINKIRNDTAMMLPDAKFYALIDDDFTFRYGTEKMNKTAGQQYVDVIHYMMNHPNCGLVMMGGTLIKTPPRYVIAPTILPNSYLTNRGYILKAMNPEDGQFLPKDAIDLLGSDEDRVLAAYRLYNGLYPAKMSSSRTTHYDNSVVPGYKMYEWNTQEILNANNHKFIRDNYFSEFDGSEYNTRVVTYDQFEKAGGIDVYDSNIVEENSTNYYMSNCDEEISEIIKYYRMEVQSNENTSSN